MPTAIWIVIGLVLLIACAGDGKKSSSQGGPIRIDHPHYFEEDDHECSACGARFRGKGMVCPRCGIQFSGTETTLTFPDSILMACSGSVTGDAINSCNL